MTKGRTTEKKSVVSHETPKEKVTIITKKRTVVKGRKTEKTKVQKKRTTATKSPSTPEIHWDSVFAYTDKVVNKEIKSPLEKAYEEQTWRERIMNWRLTDLDDKETNRLIERLMSALSARYAKKTTQGYIMDVLLEEALIQAWLGGGKFKTEKEAREYITKVAEDSDAECTKADMDAVRASSVKKTKKKDEPKRSVSSKGCSKEVRNLATELSSVISDKKPHRKEKK